LLLGDLSSWEAPGSCGVARSGGKRKGLIRFSSGYGGLKISMSTSVDVEIFRDELNDKTLSVFRLLYARCVTVYPFLLSYLSVGATPSRRLACGCPPQVSRDIECDSVLCVLLLVCLSRSPWSPFSTARVKRGGKTGRGPDARESVCSVHTSMAPRRRPREGVAEQATRPKVGDAPPPQQTQPLPQDAHSGIVPPPPQVAQGLDMTHFLEGMAQFVAQHRDAPVPQGGTGRVLREFLQFQPPQFLGQPNPDVARAWLDAVERTFRSMECVPEERFIQTRLWALSKYASSSGDSESSVLVEELREPSVGSTEVLSTEAEPTWMTPLVEFIRSGLLLED
ncbi:hypothetical protein Taro_039045, partial [Colocasia esculenta]|nr:hypothetical protein [Colocasia esculenta]